MHCMISDTAGERRFRNKVNAKRQFSKLRKIYKSYKRANIEKDQGLPNVMGLILFALSRNFLQPCLVSII